MKLYQVIYRSSAKDWFSDAELKELLLQARSYNHAHRITGMLLYSDGQFLQVIEGEEQVVQDLYARIRLDSRHLNVDTIFSGPVSRSMFPDWSMGFVTVSVAEFAWLAGYIDTNKSNFLLPRAHAFSPQVREVLLEFVNSQLAA